MIFFTCLIVLKWGKDKGGDEESAGRGRASAGRWNRVSGPVSCIEPPSLADVDRITRKSC